MTPDQAESLFRTFMRTMSPEDNDIHPVASAMMIARTDLTWPTDPTDEEYLEGMQTFADVMVEWGNELMGIVQQHLEEQQRREALRRHEEEQWQREREKREREELEMTSRYDDDIPF
jgi:glycine cleavage system protein P-like pyridoxal-binding family